MPIRLKESIITANLVDSHTANPTLHSNAVVVDEKKIVKRLKKEVIRHLKTKEER